MTANEGDLGPAGLDRPDRTRQLHLQPALIGMVVTGGTVGTAIRAALERAVPSDPGGWPWATFVVNITGAFVLGALLEMLIRTGPDSGWRRRVRLTAGTGLLGGYTTYSTFAVEIVEGARGSAPLLGPLYGLVSVALGVAAAAAGFWLATVVTPKLGRPSPVGGSG